MKKWLGYAIAFSMVGCTAWVASCVKKVRDSGRRLNCYGSLKCIGVAMHHYHDKYGHFPPAFIADENGEPAHSWRILLMEFIDPETFLAYRFDEPWNSPNNRKLGDKMPNCYACAADPESKEKHRTNYFVVVGPNTVFPGAKTVKLDDIGRSRSETLLVVEAVGQNVHWMEPKDLAFDSMSFTLNDPTRPSVSSKHRRSPNAITVDGSANWLNGVGPDLLREMLQIKKPGEK
jgi:hypothetical protein